MGQFKVIKNEDIRLSLEDKTRQYFAGNLKKPQILDFIKNDEVEIGITSYKTHSREIPHRHTIAIEYQYVINGRTQYMDLDTEEIYDFSRGDFFAIYPGTTYAQKSKPNTEILFIKVPSINDKRIMETNDIVEKWLSEKLHTIRKDYYHDFNAPKANSIRPAAAVALVSKDERILMLRRADSNNWTMPGGTMKFNESLQECAIREVFEETGLNVEIVDIIGIYTDPEVRVAYSDGEVRQEFTVLYYGHIKGGNEQIDDESMELRWINMDKLSEIHMATSQKKRIKDVIQFVIKGTRRII